MQSPSYLLRTLYRLYKAAIVGVRGLDSAYKLAEEYEAGPGTLEQKIDKLVRWQSAKCGTAGFISGLGGLVTLPIALPFDATANYFVQIRMVAVIAILCGHDVKSEKVRNLVLACLVGNALKEVLKDAGVPFAKRSLAAAVEKISADTLKHINKKVGVKLISKSGAKGFVKLHKLVPVVGGIVGGGLDIVACRTIGRVAKNVFLETAETPECPDTQ